MADARAKHSVVTQQVPPLGKGNHYHQGHWCQDPQALLWSLMMPLGVHEVAEFLYLPDCPVPLMGRDLLAKMGAQISSSLPKGQPS